MPGDVGLVAQFLNTVAEFFMDPTKYERLSREKKLEKIREGLDAALEMDDMVLADRFMDAYRKLHEETGP